jgi:hypothetical protein
MKPKSKFSEMENESGLTAEERNIVHDLLIGNLSMAKVRKKYKKAPGTIKKILRKPAIKKLYDELYGELSDGFKARYGLVSRVIGEIMEGYFEGEESAKDALAAADKWLRMRGGYEDKIEVAESLEDDAQPILRQFQIAKDDEEITLSDS